MTKFLNGPAAGQVLSIRRAPVLLRVVQSRRGEWDALDQLADEPAAGERIYLYRLEGKPGSMHLLIRGKGKKGSGFYPVAEYGFLDEQPADHLLRDTGQWILWCEENRERLMPEWAKTAEVS